MSHVPISTVFGPAPAGAGLRLALVRHGETDESLRGRCCGSLDPQLSDEGRRQMQRTSALLRRLSAAAIYSSPRQRALDSARALGMSPPVIVDDGLREIDFGLLEGLTFQEVADRYPDVWRVWMQQPTDVAFPEGERFADFSARVDRALTNLTESHHGNAIVIVAHGGVNRLVLARALGLDTRHMFRLQQTCGAVSIIDFYAGQAVVQIMNATGIADAAC
ncbi:MAG: histidine phosphatase family protein [Acidobacteria bacterium]|nr:histidine phosphatase family protein [Acidobacteriota bacterium]